MQKSSVNRLLNKKVWTGEDAGRAILIRLIDDLVRPDQPPTITQADVDKMLAGVTTAAQRNAYNFFSVLYDTISDLGQLQRTYRQMFYHGHYLEQSILNVLLMDNSAVGQKLRLPVLMTQEHYDQLKEKCSKHNKASKIDYWCAFYNVLLHIEKMPFEVQLAADEYAGEAITNKRVLSHLYDVFGLEEDEPLPEEYNKQTVLFTSLLGCYFNEFDDELSSAEQFNEFKEDYPILFNAVDKYLHTFPVFKGIQPDDYMKEIVTFEELAEQGFPALETILEHQNNPPVADIVDFIVCSKEGFSDYYRMKAFAGGIAITLMGEDAETPTDLCFAGEEDAIIEAEDIEEAIPSIQMAEYALKTMYAFNAVIDVLVECFRLDMLKDIKNDMAEFEEAVEDNSNMLRKLIRAVYGTDEEKEKKRHIYETAFPIIKVEELKPAAERVEKLKELLADTYYSTGASLVKRNAVAHYMLYLMGEREEASYGK